MKGTKKSEGHSFDCCERWMECSLGRMPCPRQEKEPDYVAGCTCFKRYQRAQQAEELPIQKEEETAPTFMAFDHEGQGYLL